MSKAREFLEAIEKDRRVKDYGPKGSEFSVSRTYNWGKEDDDDEKKGKKRFRIGGPGGTIAYASVYGDGSGFADVIVSPIVQGRYWPKGIDVKDIKAALIDFIKE